MNFIESVFKDIEPAFILDGVTTYLQLALRAYCKKNNIPYLLTENSRYSGHINISQADGRYIPMLQKFEELQKGNAAAVDTEVREKAEAALEKFVNNPTRPTYAIKNSAVRFGFKELAKKLSYTLHPKRLWPSDAVKELDRAMGYEAVPVHSLKKGIKDKIRRAEQKIYGVFNTNPDLDRPFIYLPLHYTPENSDMYFGANYDHHAGFVSQLAKHLPSDCVLYAKEHPSMVGRRPNSFYQELNSLYNVQIISPTIDTFTLIQKSRAVATVTGTAGWESYLFGKPVIALGMVFYNFLPNVYHAAINDDFKKGLDEYLKNFQVNEKERLNAFTAFYASSFVGTKGDIGPDITLSQVTENSSLFANSLRQVIRDYHTVIHGKFPEELITDP